MIQKSYGNKQKHFTCRLGSELELSVTEPSCGYPATMWVKWNNFGLNSGDTLL